MGVDFDRRIKTEILPLSQAMQTLDRVRLVDFRYTDDYLAAHPAIEDKRYLNVIAQEFAEQELRLRKLEAMLNP